MAGSQVVALGLYDNATVPAPGLNTTIGPKRRFTISRSPANAGGAAFEIVYTDSSDVTHWWTGSIWTTTPTTLGHEGLVKVSLWDDGANFVIEVHDALQGTSLFGAASIAQASVKAFAAGRVLLSGEPYTNYYAQGINLDNWILRKYVSPEPVVGVAEAEEAA